jgi:hypothetical protein
MTKDHEQSLRQHLLDLLGGGRAHAKFEDVVKDLPAKLRGAKPAKFPHSAWMLLEHMRLGQWDILEFSRNSKHVSPDWPSGYWPETEAPAECGGVEQEHSAVSPGLEGFGEAGRQPED